MTNPPQRSTAGADVLTYALAGLYPIVERAPGVDAAVRTLLAAADAATGSQGASLLAAFKASLATPREHDFPLVGLARRYELTLVELLCVRLAMAAEEDLAVGHAIAHLQAPIQSHRPTIGLLSRAFRTSLGTSATHLIAHGAAMRHGFLTVSADDLPLSERHVGVPLPICIGLQGTFAVWPNTRPLELPGLMALGKTTDTRLKELAAQLSRGDPPEVLVFRSGEPLEARAAILRLAEFAELNAVLVDGEVSRGLAPWLMLHGAAPVFQLQLAPGERRMAPHVEGLVGPVVVAAGTDGEFDTDGRRVVDFRVPIPPREERFELWKAYVPEVLAGRLAGEHRHSAARIAALGREARVAARTEDAEAAVEARHVEAAARQACTGLSSLAELVDDDVGETALVATPGLERDLAELVDRCRLRDGLVDRFGPALKARYRPGVRALFVGPSGTGKTLAASLLATRLGLPLYRVDLSSVTSKYIGETEKNLSQLLSLSEENEVVLLFDEADSLFGKRTDVRDAHDRFANAQTNFLLQRLENYDGIVILTSNSRARFDSAFARRLDAVLEFQGPGPDERRALLCAHLGDAHRVAPGDLNRLAAAADLSGGQIRMAVLSAAIHATKRGSFIELSDLILGVGAEFRKLGRKLPSDLAAAPMAAE